MPVHASTRMVHDRAELADALGGLPTGPLGLVPTMGALHEGHAALLSAARTESAAVVASIFVNPLQFGPDEDLARYPRALGADLAWCERLGVDLVWAPSVRDVYPDGDAVVTVSPGPLGGQLEGAVRPTHFTGVLTVVAKLFGLIDPQRAYFGQKDYQQLVLVRRMVRDLELDVEVIGVPTVREPDGLALSSRNAYLSAADRFRALGLSRALRAGAAAVPGGPAAVLAAAADELDAAQIVPDYLALRAEDLAEPAAGFGVPGSAPGRLLVAAKIGTPRLIDNLEVRW